MGYGLSIERESVGLDIPAFGSPRINIKFTVTWGALFDYSFGGNVGYLYHSLYFALKIGNVLKLKTKSETFLFYYRSIFSILIL